MTDTSPAANVRIEDRTFEGPHGTVPVRTYLPVVANRGLVWVHGGAFAFGDLDQAESHWVASELAARGVAVVAVDYRLAPIPEWASAVAGVPERDGVLYPVASEEVSAAFAWATTLVPGLGPDHWSLGGASAGANLSAGAALRQRDDGQVQPRSLLLSYGLFHATLPPVLGELADSYAALPPEQGVFTPEAVDLINLNYTGHPDALKEGYAFPGGHPLAGLPPTLVLNADIDSLRASGDLFASELVTAGVDVLVIKEPGTYHGYLDDPELPAATRSVERMAAWLTSDLI